MTYQKKEKKKKKEKEVFIYKHRNFKIAKNKNYVLDASRHTRSEKKILSIIKTNQKNKKK